MSVLDSPAIVALITVLGSAGSTWGAIILNKKINTSTASSVEQLKSQLAEKESIIKTMENK